MGKPIPRHDYGDYMPGDSFTFLITSGTALGTGGAIIAANVPVRKVRVFDVHVVAITSNTNLYLHSDSITGPRYMKIEVSGGATSEVFSEGILFPNGLYAETGATFQFASITCNVEP